MIGSPKGATPGVSTAGPPGPSHPPQSKLPQATTTSGICPFNNLARWRRRERRYSGGCCARDIVGGRGHPSADQTVLFPPMVSGSPPPGARWWTLSGSRVVVDCVKVPGLAVQGSLGTTTAAILMWDRCTTTRRPPSHSLVAGLSMRFTRGRRKRRPVRRLWKSALFSRKLISSAVAFWAIGL